MPDATSAAARVCHDEQLTVWSGEIVGRLAMGEHLRDDLSYDDILEVHWAVADEIRRIVEAVFAHPELADAHPPSLCQGGA